MKKTIQLLLISTLATVLLFSATILVSQIHTEKVYTSTNSTSSVYKVVDFSPPNKTVYSLEEINRYIPNDDNITCANHTLKQEIDFDGTGMTMTIEDNKGQRQTYEYTCDYFVIDGQTLKCEEYFVFDFDVDKYLNEYGLLGEGNYDADVILITDDGECLTEEFHFCIEDVPETEAETQSATQPHTEPQEPTEKSNLVIPTLKKHWNKANEEGQHIQIINQDGNNLTLLITNSNADSDTVSTQVSVELSNVYLKDGEIKGEGTYRYIDSLGNHGVGGIKVSKNSIILDMNSYHSGDTNNGWCVNSSTGKYV